MSAPAIAVLASGGGRSMQNLAEQIAAGNLDARIAVVLSNDPRAGVLDRARALGLETVVVPHRDFADAGSFSRTVFAELDRRGCELAVLAGFLRLLVLPDAWVGRVLNIHPALLPAFGGKGYYGDRVHRAVLEAGVPESGCTVHYVTNEYDAGPIVLQRRVAVQHDDTAEALAARVFAEERRALPEACRLHLSGAVRLEGDRVVRRAVNPG